MIPVQFSRGTALSTACCRSDTRRSGHLCQTLSRGLYLYRWHSAMSSATARTRFFRYFGCDELLYLTFVGRRQTRRMLAGLHTPASHLSIFDFSSFSSTLPTLNRA